MIGSEGKGFFAAHWDWLLAALGAAALAAGAAWFAMETGESPEDAAREERRDLEAAPMAAKPVADVDMGAYSAAMALLEKPAKVVEPAETQGSFLASPRRVFCEQGDAASAKKACARPIPFGTKVCPFCGAEQPKEVKVALDTDGDGIPDEVETALGLNPADPSDAAGDPDGDGFSTLDELNAKTDPKDPLSHPDYLDFFRIEGPLQATHLTILLDKVLSTPNGLRFHFIDMNVVNDWGKPGKRYSVKEGEQIGNSGFVAKGYEKRTERVTVGKTQHYDRDASIAIVQRSTDGKLVNLRAGDKRFADVDVQATVVYDREGGKSFTVVQGDTIEIHAERFSVTEVLREGKTAKVTLKNARTSAAKTLTALEQ